MEHKCCICLDGNDPPDFKTRCSHRFHLECIKQWLQVDQNQGCPFCRTLISSENIFEEKYLEVLDALENSQEIDLIDGEYVLLQTVFEGRKADLVRRLQQAGVDIDTFFDAIGRTSLMVAVQRENPKMVRCLLDLGADAEIKDQEGMNALLLACNSATISSELVQILLDKGVDMRLTNMHGQSALHYGCYRGLFQICRLLIQSGFNVNCGPDEYGLTPIQVALLMGHNDIAIFLFSSNAILDL